MGTTDPDGGAAAAFARMEEVAKATIKINRDPSKPDPREVSRREEKIREEQEATRQRIAEVHTRVEEAAAQQASDSFSSLSRARSCAPLSLFLSAFVYLAVSLLVSSSRMRAFGIVNSNPHVALSDLT